MIYAQAPHRAQYRTALVAIVIAVAWWGMTGMNAQARDQGRPPSTAVARLTSLGFSPRDARCLLLITQTRPETQAGAIAAQRIAMAVLWGNAHAFGSAGHHPRPDSSAGGC
jgi:hypothetical protein